MGEKNSTAMATFTFNARMPSPFESAASAASDAEGVPAPSLPPPLAPAVLTSRRIARRAKGDRNPSTLPATWNSVCS